MYTSNANFISRKVFKEKEDIQIVEKINKELFDYFVFVAFEASSFTSEEFHYWWSGYIAKTFSQNVADVLEGFTIEKNPKVSEKKKSSQVVTPQKKVSEKIKADSTSVQPQSEGASKRVQSKFTDLVSEL